MHAFLLITNSTAKARARAQEIADTRSATFLDQIAKTIKDVALIKNTNALSFTKATVFYIQDLDQSSIPAQNALLKLIEEPQPNVTIVLHATNKERVLETIRSRCQIESLSSDDVVVSEELRDFYTLNTDKKLLLVSKITNRQDGKKFLEQIIALGHRKLKEGVNVADSLEKAVLAADALAANANVTLQLTNFVIQIG